MATRLKELLVRISSDITGAVKGIDQVENRLAGVRDNLKSFGSSARRAGGEMTRGISLPLLGMATGVVAVANNFETEMQKIVGLVGQSQEQVDAWGREILSLAPKLGKAPVELAEGLYFVTSAGIAAEDAMGVLEASAKASTAGLGRVATIADAVTSAVNAYGIENLSAARATDILVAAVKEGKLEAEALAPVLGRILPTASAMRIGFEQVAGSLAVMSRTGLGAEEAATSLQAVLSTLLKPVNGMQDKLNQAGLSVAGLRDMAAGPAGLIGVMGLLGETFKDDDEALAQLFPNVRALRGVMNVLAQDGQTVAGVMTGVADSAGLTDEAFATAADTGAFRLKAAMGELKVVGIELGETVVPIVTDALGRLAGFLREAGNWWRGLTPETQKFIVISLGVLAVLGPLITMLGVLALAIAAILSPVGLVLVAVLALSALALILWKNWDTVKEFFVGLWADMKSIFQQSVAFIGQILLNFTAAGLVIKHWDSITGFFRATWEAVAGFFRGGVDRVALLALSLPSRILAAFFGLQEKMEDIGRNLMEGLANGIKNTISKPVEAAKSGGKKLWEGTKNVLGISSPSKLFAEIGENVSLGLGQGILAEGDGVLARMAALSNTMAKTDFSSEVTLGVDASRANDQQRDEVSIVFEPGAISITAPDASAEALAEATRGALLDGLERRWARQVF